MNKNSIIIISILAVALLGITGYVVWSAYNPSPVVVQNTPMTTTTTKTVNSAQSGYPIVQTNSNTVPYISTVVVNGTVNPNGAPTTYWYEYGQTSALGTQTGGYLIGSGYANIYAPAYIINLLSNTNYYFRLVASNSFGTVNGATYSFRTNTIPAPSGTAPTVNTSSATNITRTAANLNGQINPKNSVTTFWFEYGLNSNLGTFTSFQTSDTSNSLSTISAQISNLQPFTKYYFRLTAQNQFGTVNGQILNFTTNGPVAATVPTVNANSANAITSSSAKLNASVNPNGAQTTCWFEYGINSSLPINIVAATAKQSLNDGVSSVSVSSNIGNLINNTKYYFRVVAENQYGTVRSNINSFTTKK